MEIRMFRTLALAAAVSHVAACSGDDGTTAADASTSSGTDATAAARTTSGEATTTTSTAPTSSSTSDPTTGPTSDPSTGDTGSTTDLTGTTGEAVCGDGEVQPGEACDDGNADETDACLATCVAASCGD
ncbi:MAG: hypothetical protein H0T76_17370, partial [Nannocystis sp.]|nr:hypothetical protein [Nannocystis sp.]